MTRSRSGSAARRVSFELNTSVTRVVDVVGVPNGRVVINGSEFSPVLFLQWGLKKLQEWTGDQEITPAEAGSLEAAMRDAGLVESLADVLAMFERWTPPSDLIRTHRFERCDCGSRDAHGYIYNMDGDAVSGTIYSIAEGLACCDCYLLSGALSPNMAATLAREIAFPATGEQMPLLKQLLMSPTEAKAILLIFGGMGDELTDGGDEFIGDDEYDDWWRMN